MVRRGDEDAPADVGVDQLQESRDDTVHLADGLGVALRLRHRVELVEPAGPANRRLVLDPDDRPVIDLGTVNRTAEEGCRTRREQDLSGSE